MGFSGDRSASSGRAGGRAGSQGLLCSFLNYRVEALLPVPGRGRQAAMIFILITVFIDVLGIGIIIPILPELSRLLAPGAWQIGGDGNTAGSCTQQVRAVWVR